MNAKKSTSSTSQIPTIKDALRLIGITEIAENVYSIPDKKYFKKSKIKQNVPALS